MLAYIDDLLIAGTSRDTALFLAQLRQSLRLKHSTVLTSQQPLRFLRKGICRHPNGDITVSLERSYYYSMLKHVDLDNNNIYTIVAATSSTTRFITGSRLTSHLQQKRWNAHLGISSTSRDLQFTAKEHTLDSFQLQCNGIGHISSIPSRTSKEPCTTSSSSHLDYLKVIH